MEFTVTINLDNAAFQAGAGEEVKRILENQVIYEIQNTENFTLGDKGNLQDFNGNNVGRWQITEY